MTVVMGSYSLPSPFRNLKISMNSLSCLSMELKASDIVFESRKKATYIFHLFKINVIFFLSA